MSNALKSFLHRFMLPPQTVLAQTPFSFDMSWWTALMGLATGGTVVVAGQTVRRDPCALTRLVAREGITFTFAVPSELVSWIQNADLGQLRNSKWTFHCSAGEAASWSFIDQLQRFGKHDLRVVNAYGPTETMIPTVHEINYASMTPADMPVPIGRPLPNYNVYVVDEQGKPVPAGVPGQLVVSGAGVATGYVNDKLSSAERFPLDHLVDTDFLHRGWTHCHLTGDECYVRKADGVLIMQGRKDGDTQIKIRGLRMDLLDVETHLVATAGGNVAHAIVQAYKSDADDASGHFLVAHVVFSDQGRLWLRSEPEQTAFLARVVAEMPVPDYMRPSRLLIVESLPLTPNGKIDRRLVAKWRPSSTATRDDKLLASDQFKNAENHELATMAAVWKRVLGEAVAPFPLAGESDFFAVGGNSFLLIRARTEIQKDTGIYLELPQLFQHSTLAGMADLIKHDTDDSSTAPISSTINWEEETKLGDLSQLSRIPGDKTAASGNLVVALTGATGFLGKSLLKSLVRSPQVGRVHCLAVRDVTRLRNFTSPKIVVHMGDLCQPRLGMTPEEARDVFTSASVVVHNGADTSFMKSYTTLKTVNLTSTRELARLSLNQGSQVSHFHYVSTAGIASQLQRDLYDESLGPIPASDGAQGYIYSKWASEAFLEKLSRAAGLSLTIHRPTAIVGDGAPQLDVMSSVLRFSEVLGRVPQMDGIEGHFQFVEVDAVAKDIVHSVVTLEDVEVTSPSPQPLVRYRNHCGPPEYAVSVPCLGAFLSKKLRRPIGTQSDADWILEARKAGLPAEVAAYLGDLGAAFQSRGKKWIFPRVWNGMPP
jgi:hybrid polyketide synthase / nonribosomal peptide synthetase ACE1